MRPPRRQDSQGQILALVLRYTSSTPTKVFPLYSEAARFLDRKASCVGDRPPERQVAVHVLAASMAHIRQSRPDSGRGLQVQVLKAF